MITLSSVSGAYPDPLGQIQSTVAYQSDIPLYTEIRYHRHHYGYARPYHRHYYHSRHYYYPEYYYYPHYRGGYRQHNYHYPFYRGGFYIG